MAAENSNDNEKNWGPVDESGLAQLGFTPPPKQLGKYFSDPQQADQGFFSIQICSDLHLEFYPLLIRFSFDDQQNDELKTQVHQLFSQFIQPSSSSNLALLGDIGDPSQFSYAYFLKWCAQSIFFFSFTIFFFFFSFIIFSSPFGFCNSH
jgi:hypothetical protein